MIPDALIPITVNVTLIAYCGYHQAKMSNLLTNMIGVFTGSREESGRQYMKTEAEIGLMHLSQGTWNLKRE